MKAEELRIGNLVLFKEVDLNTGQWMDSLITIGYRDIQNLEVGSPEIKANYNPIPLTEEQLVKWGFIKDNDGILVKDKCIYWLKPDIMQIALDYAPLFNCPCSYIHQFQNLYFSLTGKEL